MFAEGLICFLVFVQVTCCQSINNNQIVDITNSVIANINKLSDFNDTSLVYNLTDNIAKLADFWPLFRKSPIHENNKLTSAQVRLSKALSNLQTRYYNELINISCPLSNMFTRYSERVTQASFTNIFELLFERDEVRHSNAAAVCNRSVIADYWKRDITYLDDPIGNVNSPSLHITNTNYCTCNQRLKLNKRVAQLELTLYIIPVKMCFHVYYGSRKHNQTAEEVVKKMNVDLKSYFDQIQQADGNC